VKLKGVPIQFWNKVGLSYIASVLGKPIEMDATTMSRYALLYARVCVDMKATSDFPESITLELEDGSTTIIEVEYPWRPAACMLCKVFDHSNWSCPRVTRSEWIPRPVLLAHRKPEDAEGWITVGRKENSAVKKEPAPSVVEAVGEAGKAGSVHECIMPPKTPLKVVPDNPQSHHSSRDGGKATVEVGGNYLPNFPRKLLPGSSSGLKKRKKKGHGGQGGLGLAGPDDVCCHLECEGLE
ncbi:DUF4283 domain-containing protein/zf-CCHC_4 domain-containing protein, partial [Cephalotus follicularis]